MTDPRLDRPSRLFAPGHAVLMRIAGRARAIEIEGDLIELWHARRCEGRRDLRRAYLRDVAGFVRVAMATRGRSTARSVGSPVRSGGGFGVITDVRYAVRLFKRQPVFSVAAIATLTLGIAASTSIFTAVDRLLLRPLPYPEPDRLMHVEGAPVRFDSGPALSASFRALDVFSGVGIYAPGGANLDGADAARVTLAVVDDGFFRAMDVNPLLGGVLPAFDADGYPRLAVLSYDAWRTRFRADRGIVGTSISLNGQSYAVTGVMPPGFTFPGRTDLWVPPGADFQFTGSVFAPDVVARLAPGVLPDQAQAALVAYDANTSRPGSDREAPVITPLARQLTANVRPVLMFLTVSVVLLLLVVCTNVANLLLSRVALRRQEFAVRRALGGSRWRLVRQLLVESLLLSTFAAGLGILIAGWTLRSLRVLAPDVLGNLGFGTIDLRLLALTAAVSLLTTLVFGLAPGAVAAAQPASHVVRSGRDDGGSPGWRRFRSALVITQMAAALLLLTGGAAAVGSLVKAASVDLGFHSGRALGMTLTLPMTRYEGSTNITAFFERASERLLAAPGVRRVAGTSRLPGSREMGVGLSVDVLGRPAAPDGPPFYATYLSASADYFTVMGIPVLEGRAFRNQDRKGAPPVAILSASAARSLFPTGDSPLGRRVTIGRPGPRAAPPHEIVGVVADVRLRGPDDDGRQLQQLYVPLLQSPPFGNLSLVAEIDGDPALAAAGLRAALHGVDPNLPLYDLHTLDTVVDRFLASHRLALVLVGGFALITVFVAAIGLYGMTQQLVAARSREIGIRIALGADPGGVRRRIVVQGAGHAAAGGMIGLVSGLGALETARAFVPGLDGIDPAVLAVNTTVLVVVAVAAAWMPATRAARINPVDAIRSQG